MIDQLNKTDSNLIELIPDPDTVRCWLAEAIRRSDLLRSLLRLAVRKAAYKRPSTLPEGLVAGVETPSRELPNEP